MKNHYIFLHRQFRLSGLLVTMIILLPFSACKKFLEIPNPDNQVVSSAVFNDDKTATSAVVGLYSQMVSFTPSIMGGGLTFYTSLSSDDLIRNTSNVETDPFQNNALTADNYTVQTYFWRYGYVYIYQANACLEGIEASTGMTDATKKQLRGELLFLRSVVYFYLVNLFGDVPLITKTPYQSSSTLPRTEIATVYQQIVSDLKEAENSLPVTYPTAGQVRANKYAATTLLARIYLYLKDYRNAEEEASIIINSGQYSLLTDLNSVFLAGSKEAILQFYSAFSGNTNTFEGGQFVPALTTIRPTYSLRNTLVNAFTAGDKRKSAWVGTNVASGVSYYYPNKYKIRSNAVKTEYTVVLRYAELFLIRAEARAMLNDLSGSITDINTIRQRAGLNSLPANLTQSACLSAVALENQLEFFVEWGHRWFDLKRTGQIDAVLGSAKSTWKPYQELYPIPLTEIQSNVYLTQNQGY